MLKKRFKNFRGVKTLSLFFLFFLVACAGGPRNLGGTSHVAKELRHQIIQSLQGRNEVVQSLRAVASSRVGPKLFSSRGDVMILLKKPDRLRLDLLSPVGLDDAQTTFLDGFLTIYWAGVNRFFYGPATRDSLQKYLLVSLDADSVICFLSGGVPLEEEESYTLHRHSQKKRFVLKGVDGELIVMQQGENYLPVQYTAYHLDHDRFYTIDYLDYQEGGGGWFPGRLTARFWKPRSRLTLHFHEVEINPSLKNRLFQLKIPEDATLVTD